MALASPIPLNFWRSERERRAKLWRLSPISDRILLDKSTAVSFLFPDPIKMAINSALDNADFPFNNSFSLGLSSSAHSVITLLLCLKSFKKLLQKKTLKGNLRASNI